MRMPRVLAQGEGCYHVISRVSGQRFLLDADEKDRLVRFMSAAAGFSGVEVLAFAFMDNHFHMLVKVPLARDVEDAELVQRVRTLYGNTRTDRILRDWEMWGRKGLEFKVLDAKSALRRRMYSLSQFCKTLKETYSMSYNSRHGHVGSIWGSRFKSVLVAPDYRTLMTVAAYINLNPVRAGAVDDPAGYRWTGYGSALHGNALSRKGVCALVGAAYGQSEAVTFETALAACNAAMEGYVDAPASTGEPDAASPRPAHEHAPEFNAAKVDAAIREGKPLTAFETLRCKVRYFSHGTAIGPAAFVRTLVMRLAPDKDTARKCDGCGGLDLYTARRLRGDGKLSVPRRHVA